MSSSDVHWLKWITELQAIAQNGLAYSNNDFDIERFNRLRDVAAELAAHCSDHPLEEVKKIFSLQQGYATPKLDVRSFILKENKLLMVKERTDDLWSLPGGWVDVNESPSEAVIRETKEETGFNVATIKLLAFWDKLKHNHPLHWPHTYKCIFQCELISGAAMENIEISAIAFFAMDNLPPLSTPRITEQQLIRLYEQTLRSDQTLFD